MAESGGKFTLATWNVNSVRTRLATVCAWLEREKPDALCLQEIKCQTEVFPAETFEGIGYRSAVFGQKAYNGVAILSREPLKEVVRGLGDGKEKEEPARLIRARVRGVTVVNTYVPQGHEPDSDKFRYKLAWLARLRKFFETNFTTRQRVLWCGDMNVAPTDMDIYNPKGLLGHVGFCPEVWKALGDVVDWGFTDVFRKHRPEPGWYSYYDYRARDPVRNKTGWRVDHVYCTKSLAAKSTDSWIDTGTRIAEKPSDHCPVSAEFEL
ncbi:MAG: exodeoxyribonuclease III [Planctomycetota bacterium]|jgi:exodeoxyribonuclease-3